MSKSSVGRRAFLSAIPAVLCGAPWVIEQVGRAAGALPAERLFEHARQAAFAIGTRYLREYPQEDDRGLLTAFLEGHAPRLHHLSQSEVRDYLRSRCSDDFERGDTVVVDGWVLSRTEARMCALVALSAA